MAVFQVRRIARRAGGACIVADGAHALARRRPLGGARRAARDRLPATERQTGADHAAVLAESGNTIDS